MVERQELTHEQTRANQRVIAEQLEAALTALRSGTGDVDVLRQMAELARRLVDAQRPGIAQRLKNAGDAVESFGALPGGDPMVLRLQADGMRTIADEVDNFARAIEVVLLAAARGIVDPPTLPS